MIHQEQTNKSCGSSNIQEAVAKHLSYTLKSNSGITGNNENVKMHSKIAMLNIFKTSLSLKVCHVYISNDMIIMYIPIFLSFCRLNILISFVL